MKKYEEPKLEVEVFDVEDIITASGGSGGSGGLELPDQPL